MALIPRGYGGPMAPVQQPHIYNPPSTTYGQVKNGHEAARMIHEQKYGPKDERFQFDRWCDYYELDASTKQILREEGLYTLHALSRVIPEQIEQIGISRQQQRRLKTGVNEIAKGICGEEGFRLALWCDYHGLDSHTELILRAEGLNTWHMLRKMTSEKLEKMCDRLSEYQKQALENAINETFPGKLNNVAPVDSGKKLVVTSGAMSVQPKSAQNELQTRQKGKAGNLCGVYVEASCNRILFVIAIVFLLICGLTAVAYFLMPSILADIIYGRPLISASVTTKLFTYEEAKEYCEAMDGTLPFPNDDKQIEVIKKAAYQEKKTVFWLAIKRNIQEHAAFTDGSVYLNSTETEAKGCCYLDIHGIQPKCADCHLERFGYICKLHDKVECHPTDRKRHHIKVDDVCYLVSWEKLNWFHARSRCKDADGDLAQWSNLEQRQRIEREIEDKSLNPAKQSEFWIGLSWFRLVCDIGYESHQAEVPIDAINWDHQQPSEKGNCVKAEVRGQMLLWFVEDCNTKLSVLCLKSQCGLVSGIHPVTDAVAKNQKQMSSSTIFGMISGYIFLVVTVSFVVTIILMSRRYPALRVCLTRVLFEQRHANPPANQQETQEQDRELLQAVD